MNEILKKKKTKIKKAKDKLDRYWHRFPFFTAYLT